MPAYSVLDAFGSNCSFVIPAWNQSTPDDAGLGLGGVLPCRSVEIANDAPPSVEV
jgi:hypothetical protein